MTSTDEESQKPVFTCAACGGPIYFGEMVTSNGTDVSHRFRTWCQFYNREDPLLPHASNE